MLHSGGAVAHSVRRQIRDYLVAGSTLSRVPLRINLGQVSYTYTSLSPSNIIRYRPNGWGVNRHTTRCTSRVSVVSQCKVRATQTEISAAQ